MMSRKHYREVAAMLHATRERADELGGSPLGDANRDGYLLAVTRITASIADVFAADNERFDRERFNRAVVLGEGLGVRR